MTSWFLKGPRIENKNRARKAQLNMTKTHTSYTGQGVRVKKTQKIKYDNLRTLLDSGCSDEIWKEK